jgi:hypothetical protein
MRLRAVVREQMMQSSPMCLSEREHLICSRRVHRQVERANHETKEKVASQALKSF